MATVKHVLSSWAAAYIPVFAVCFLTVHYPLTHELLHQVGASLLGLPAVVTCYPTATGLTYACFVPMPVPKWLGAILFQQLSLPLSFPYIVCLFSLVSLCILYLSGLVLTEKKRWFADTLLGTLIAVVIVVVFYVYPCWTSEWITDLASFFSSL